MEKILTYKQVKELGWNKISIITANMLKGYTSIGYDAFYNYRGLTSIEIPNSVTSIEVQAFFDCTGLTSVTIPNSVTSIGYRAFYGCSDLASVTIPNSVTSIGDEAFSGCSGLTSVTIGNSVTSIGDKAFSLVANIVYSGSATGSPWGARSINGYVDGYLVYSDETKTNLLACSSAATGDITIPNSVTSIGDKAFYGCKGLTSIKIPNSVTIIGKSAFAWCSGLASVTIPNSITSIGVQAFAYLGSLQNKLSEYKKDNKGQIIAYKGFKKIKNFLVCREFYYEKGKTYELDSGDVPQLCAHGFHACLNPLDCFSYYYGKLGSDVVIYRVYLDGISNEKRFDTKVVARKITIGEELSFKEISKIVNI